MKSIRHQVARISIVGALALAVAACGGGDETTFSTPDDTAAVTESSEAPASDDAVSGDEATDLEAELRASDAFDDPDFMSLPVERQDCVISAVAARPSLAESALSDTGPDVADGLELTTILLECAPEMVRELMSDGDETGDAMLDALSDQQLECIVDALVADPTVLSDAIEGGDGTAMGLALLDCAPDVVAESMADELGVTADQAACLLEEDGVLMQLMLAGDDVSEEDAFSFLDDMFVAFEDCGIDVESMMDESMLESDLDAVVPEPLDFDELRQSCADGDMESCDVLFFQSEVGSDDEDFGATCGGTADGSTAGSCSYVPPTAEEIAEYRAGCEAGDMDACDDLYYASDIGSDDEEFGATCGGTTDGTEPGTCWLGS
jgi:hypothetical protein